MQTPVESARIALLPNRFGGVANGDRVNLRWILDREKSKLIVQFQNLRALLVVARAKIGKLLARQPMRHRNTSHGDGQQQREQRVTRVVRLRHE
jgi:hypothetical protein